MKNCSGYLKNLKSFSLSWMYAFFDKSVFVYRFEGKRNEMKYKIIKNFLQEGLNRVAFNPWDESCGLEGNPSKPSDSVDDLLAAPFDLRHLSGVELRPPSCLPPLMITKHLSKIYKILMSNIFQVRILTPFQKRTLFYSDRFSHDSSDVFFFFSRSRSVNHLSEYVDHF